MEEYAQFVVHFKPQERNEYDSESQNEFKTSQTFGNADHAGSEDSGSLLESAFPSGISGNDDSR